MAILRWGLVIIPVTFIVRFFFDLPLLLFILAGAAIIPLAGLMGEATEDLAANAGPRIGGFLNATFGNAAELIIVFFAIMAGELEVVKASITGSFIGNILLILGLSILAGSAGKKEQQFNRETVAVQATMLIIAVIGLFVPSLFIQAAPAISSVAIEALSLSVAAILMLTYAAALIFTFVTHRNLFSQPRFHSTGDRKSGKAILLLLIATAFVAAESEFLVSSIAPVTEVYGLNELFIGVVVIALIGNAAEHGSAVLLAARDNLEASVEIAVGSSIQIALFVAPLIVFLSLALGNPMTLVFNVFELVAVGVSVAILNFIALDGKTNWLEGLQLNAVYLILALAFFFIP